MFNFADFHCDTLLNIYLREMDFAQFNQAGHLDLPRLRQAGFLLQCFAVFADPKFGQEAALRQTLRLIDVAREKIFSQPDMVWLKTAEDLHRAMAAGKIAGLLSIEGADFLGDDLFLLDLVYDMGVRLITLTWNWRNTIADGIKVGGSGGLTDFGHKAVKKMQDLGIIVDVSHLSEAGFWDVNRVSSRPYVATHSNAWEVCKHPRNLKNEQIKEIARAKGLIGMNLCRPFVSSKADEQTLSTVVRHIRHIADLVGTDVICLGCDLDGIRELPQGMKDVRDLAGLPNLLLNAGFVQAEIEAICSENLVRYITTNLE